MRAVVFVALCACSIKSIDYTGKQCDDRCPDGYLCNQLTHTCAREIMDDAPVTKDVGRTPDAAVDRVSDSCFQNPRGTLVYSSDFAEYPQGWQAGGDGNWERRETELYQSSSTADAAWVSHAVGNGSGLTSDYRIVATMRLGDLSDASVGIVFRVGALTMYGCAMEPLGGRLSLRYVQQGIDVSMGTKQVTMSNPLASFTMEIDATGTTLSCCIRGLAAATLSAPDATFPTGRAGLGTKNDEGAFSSFYAYE